MNVPKVMLYLMLLGGMSITDPQWTQIDRSKRAGLDLVTQIGHRWSIAAPVLLPVVPLRCGSHRVSTLPIVASFLGLAQPIGHLSERLGRGNIFKGRVGRARLQVYVEIHVPACLKQPISGEAICLITMERQQAALVNGLPQQATAQHRPVAADKHQVAALPLIPGVLEDDEAGAFRRLNGHLRPVNVRNLFYLQVQRQIVTNLPGNGTAPEMVLQVPAH